METYSHFISDSSSFEETSQCNSNEYFTQNLSAYSDERDIAWFFYSNMDHILIGKVMPVIFFLGIIGNGLFIFATFRVPSMRTITNFYLVNLAMADVCYLTFGIGEKLACLYTSPLHSDVHSFGIVWCATIFPLVRMCAFASLFLVTLMTLDKYYAICWPLQHRVRTSPGRSNTKYVILAVWIVASGVAALTVPATSSYLTFCVEYPDSDAYTNYPDIVSYCYPMFPWVTTLVNGIQTLPFFFALFPNFYMYAQIIRRLNERLNGNVDIPQFIRNGIKIRNAVAKMLVLNGMVFFCCNIPFYSVSLIYMVLSLVATDTRKYWQTTLQPIMPHAQLLLYVNSAVNPYLYNTVNRAYRRALWKALFCTPLGGNGKPTTLRISSGCTVTEDTHL